METQIVTVKQIIEDDIAYLEGEINKLKLHREYLKLQLAAIEEAEKKEVE